LRGGQIYSNIFYDSKNNVVGQQSVLTKTIGRCAQYRAFLYISPPRQTGFDRILSLWLWFYG
jgi:hypothetical protein